MGRMPSLSWLRANSGIKPNLRVRANGSLQYVKLEVSRPSIEYFCITLLNPKSPPDLRQLVCSTPVIRLLRNFAGYPEEAYFLSDLSPTADGLFASLSPSGNAPGAVNEASIRGIGERTALFSILYLNTSDCKAWRTITRSCRAS